MKANLQKILTEAEQCKRSGRSSKAMHDFHMHKIDRQIATEAEKKVAFRHLAYIMEVKP
jgi:hypothetical protein